MLKYDRSPTRISDPLSGIPDPESLIANRGSDIRHAGHANVAIKVVRRRRVNAAAAKQASQWTFDRPRSVIWRSHPIVFGHPIRSRFVMKGAVGQMRSGNERFRSSQRPLDFTLAEFWQWAASDLLSNALRGVLAEFLVARAVGAHRQCRVEWDACDVRTATGVRVEVKASGYVQSWPQSRPTVPSFEIAPKRSWEAATNTYANTATRPADVYVFALHAHRERSTIDPMDVGQWDFFIVPTWQLDAECGSIKRIGLPRVLALAVARTPYERLADAISVAGQRA